MTDYSNRWNGVNHPAGRLTDEEARLYAHKCLVFEKQKANAHA